MIELICQNEQRREAVRQHKALNGLDYLEVGKSGSGDASLENQRFLRVYFLGKSPVELDETNVRIEGGRRIRDIRVTEVKVQHYESIELDDYMEVTVDRPGDFSTYTLQVVEPEEGGGWRPHSGFDPRYDRVDFSFKVDCPSDLDCKPITACPPELANEPAINYLAKDYASFRQLILDRLALVMPEWKERHVPDLGIALVEVLAYVGDHLSYYQDAVATEAYLDTARRRISVRRHARLVDYAMHEGCNARAWVCVETNTNFTDLPLEPKNIQFITRLDKVLPSAGTVLAADDLQRIPGGAHEIFEPVGETPIQLYGNHNKVHFYTWGNTECCLPKGATRVTLKGKLIPEPPAKEPPCDPVDSHNNHANKTRPVVGAPGSDDSDNDPPSESSKLYLKSGDVLIFEEIIGPETHYPGDADPKHRQAVRLIQVEAGIDPLNAQPVVEITWSDKDALSFPLCLSSLGPSPDGLPPECEIKEVSIARGNVILIDHGQTIEEGLEEVPKGEAVAACCKGEGILGEPAIISGRYQPSLSRAPLTFAQPLAVELLSASEVFEQDPRQALPQILLTSIPAVAGDSSWQPRQDLLGSGADDQHFVAETESDGKVHLRFGNGELGRAPTAGMAFHAEYRIGSGRAGNVGAEAIAHICPRSSPSQPLEGITRIRNPMPALGGTELEPIAEVKLFAPHAFRKTLQRAITAEDYAAIVQREFPTKVQRAAARLRWTGSWHEVLVAIDPMGQEEADPDLLNAITGLLHRYRRIGHDLVVKSAHRVPLDIGIRVCVLPHYLRGHVKAALLDLFSNRLLSNGKPGFFHPDNLTFGEGIYLSHLVAAAQGIEGVESVQVTKLQRMGELPNQEIENGILPLGPFEIARLDNDPSLPENGKLVLDVRGGR